MSKKDPPKRTVAVEYLQDDVDRVVKAAGKAGMTVHDFCRSCVMKGVVDAGC